MTGERISSIEFTPREKTVVQMLVVGYSDSEMAEALSTTSGDLRKFIFSMCKKKGADSSFKLALSEVKLGHVEIKESAVGRVAVAMKSLGDDRLEKMLEKGIDGEKIPDKLTEDDLKKINSAFKTHGDIQPFVLYLLARKREGASKPAMAEPVLSEKSETSPEKQPEETVIFSGEGKIAEEFGLAMIDPDPNIFSKEQIEILLSFRDGLSNKEIICRNISSRGKLGYRIAEINEKESGIVDKMRILGAGKKYKETHIGFNLGKAMSRVTLGQRRIIELFVVDPQASTYPKIAKTLNLSEKTIETELEEVYKSFEIWGHTKDKKIQLAAIYLEAIRQEEEWIKKIVEELDIRATNGLLQEESMVFDAIGKAAPTKTLRELALDLGKSDAAIADHIANLCNKFGIDVKEFGRNRRFWLAAIWKRINRSEAIKLAAGDKLSVDKATSSE